MMAPTMIMNDGILLFSSSLIGVAAYLVLKPLIDDLFHEEQIEYEAWNRNQLRLKKLRESSSMYRVCERWIQRTSRLLDRRAGLLVKQRRRDTTIDRALDWILAAMFGSPKTVDESVRIRANEQPWLSIELFSAGFLYGGVSLLCSAFLFQNSMRPIFLVATSVFVGFAAHRVWLQIFIMRARERRSAVRQLLPHSIDMIAMILQSGGTFVAGIDAVIRDFPSHPLSTELMVMRNRLERGQSMRESVEITATTICLPEFDEVARILSRIHEYGAPSSENFLKLSKQMRIAHLRRMEEQVGQAESKMSFPTMLVLISCMLVCLAPFLLSMIESKIYE